MTPRIALFGLLCFSTIFASQQDDEADAPAPKQRVLFELKGARNAGGFGQVIAPAGDLDGDGVSDLIIGASQLSFGARQHPGKVLLVSGADGSTLTTLTGMAAGEGFGSAVALLSDLNGDDWPEILVGAPRHDEYAINGGAARVYSGKDGELLTFKASRRGEPEPLQVLGEEPFGYLGTSVAATGDIDQDGVDDFLVAGPSDPTVDALPGQVLIVSGTNGSVLARHWGDDALEKFGHVIATVSDRDDDTFADIAVGAPGFRGKDKSPAGRVVIISARSGQVILELPGRDGERFGSSLARVADVDGDGVFELLVGAPGATPNGPESGRAYLISGATGKTLATFDGAAAYDQFGFSVAAPGDVDGDGSPDLLVGSHGADPGGYGSGAARVLSATDGRVILDILGDQQATGLGYAVSAVGDLDGDGLADLALGQLAQEPAAAGVGALRVIAGIALAEEG
ncbi:MAG: hypothetical protein ACI9EF_001257 [Pseudohongiellaceae bacterium]|jgi:hypothetical protein